MEEIESVEAIPKGAKEPTLEVASKAVEAFLADKKLASVYRWPPALRQLRHRRRWDDDDDDYDEELFD